MLILKELKSREEKSAEEITKKNTWIILTEKSKKVRDQIADQD
jgi:hypothetical protein